LKLDKGFETSDSFFLIEWESNSEKKGDADPSRPMAIYSIKFSPDLPHPYFEWHGPLASKPLSPLIKSFPRYLRRMAQFRYYSQFLKLF
jgi:hypothetical protein